jgi:hypothetical protein
LRRLLLLRLLRLRLRPLLLLQLLLGSLRPISNKNLNRIISLTKRNAIFL